MSRACETRDRTRAARAAGTGLWSGKTGAVPSVRELWPRPRRPPAYRLKPSSIGPNTSVHTVIITMPRMLSHRPALTICAMEM